MARPGPAATTCAVLALLLAGCGGSDGTTEEDRPSEQSLSAATAVDPCALLTDDQVLEATGSTKLAFPRAPQEVGSIVQCEWDPSGRDGNVVRVVLAYLPVSPDYISSELESEPAEEGLGEHVREKTSDVDTYLEVVNGDTYLSISLDDNAKLLADGPAVARTLITQAFANVD